MAENGKSHEIAHPKKGAFLAAFEKSASVTEAAEAAGIHRRTHYDWLENDDEYEGRFKEAKEVACETLESEARRRAVDGWDEPVFFKEGIVGYKRRFDSTLLIFLLKANNPEKFADRHQHEHSGRGGGPINHSISIQKIVDELQEDPAYIEAARTKARERYSLNGSSNGNGKSPT